MKRRRSYKTTSFAVMAAVGVAITSAIRTGVLDGSKMPDWVNVVAGLLSVIGTAGLGMVARDNDITSAESGADLAQHKRDTEMVLKEVEQRKDEKL